MYGEKLRNLPGVHPVQKIYDDPTLMSKAISGVMVQRGPVEFMLSKSMGTTLGRRKSCRSAPT